MATGCHLLLFQGNLGITMMDHGIIYHYMLGTVVSKVMSLYNEIFINISIINIYAVNQAEHLGLRHRHPLMRWS